MKEKIFFGPNSIKINGFLLLLLLFLGIVVLTSIYYPLRYLKYLLPLTPFLFYHYRDRIPLDGKILNYYLTFIVFYSLVIGYFLIRDLFFGSISPRFFPNVVFTLAPLLFITLMQPFFKWEKLHQYIFVILVVNIAVFLYEDLFDLLEEIANLAVFERAVLSSTINTESHLGFTFGILLIYFVVEKYNKWYIIITALFLILCFKRIVIVSVLVCIPTYYLLTFLKINITKYRTFWTIIGVSANVLYIQFTHLIVSGYFDEFVLKYTGFSTDRFLMGRQQFYTEAFKQAGSFNWFGIGIGKIDDIMLQYYGAQQNLHSEILRNYFEYGFVIFVAWLFFLFYKNLFSNKAAIFLLYFNILLLTDNAFVYFDVLFYFYFFIFIFQYQKYKLSVSFPNI